MLASRRASRLGWWGRQEAGHPSQLPHTPRAEASSARATEQQNQEQTR